MNAYPPLAPESACFVCGGCNRLEMLSFAGLAFCPGSDDESKRVDRKSDEVIEQCKMIMAGLADKMSF